MDAMSQQIDEMRERERSLRQQITELREQSTKNDNLYAYLPLRHSSLELLASFFASQNFNSVSPLLILFLYSGIANILSEQLDKARADVLQMTKSLQDARLLLFII